jgi:cytochrome-b5 reductase
MSSLDTDLLTPVAVAVIVVAATILYYTKFRHPVALKPTFQAWPLIEKQVLSHDTRRFTFAFPSPNMKLGLPVGQHMTLQFVDENGKAYQRSYTPVSHELGKVSFCIKVYKPMPPKFPNGGTVSQHLDSLKIGDTMNIKGPKGHLEYFGKGKFAIHHNRKPTEYRVAKEIGMIAGGTGITPMLQVLHAIFENPNDQTKCKLLYANQTEDDILVRPELEALVTKYPNRFQLYYTLDHPPKGWTQGSGFITAEMIRDHLYSNPKLGAQIQVFMCGPPMMVKKACLPNLEELGFSERDWYVF